MKFDTYIEEQYKALGLVTEEYQDSNVIKDFFKNVKYVAKGGKPPVSPIIELKDNRKVDLIKTYTKPTYDAADKALGRKLNPKAIEGNKINVNVIAKNVYDILRASVMSGRGGKITTDIYNILSASPQISKQGGGKPQSVNFSIDKDIKASKIPYETVEKTVKAVLQPAIDAGILKWDQPREYSPKDLFNKLVNKIAGGVKQTAGEVWANYDTIAKM